MCKQPIVLFIFWSSTYYCEGARLKRVVNGFPLVDRQPYNVIKYMIWIGYGRDLVDRFNPYNNHWEVNRHICGGALLTPRIVQSACHCFCDFQGPAKNNFIWAVRSSKTMELVAGHSEVGRIGEVVGINHYVIHPMCMKEWDRNRTPVRTLQASPKNISGLLIHDFALLVTSSAIESSMTVSMAPVYPLKDMALAWERITLNEAVCLVVGWGRYQGRNVATKSSVLRHGWMIISSYEECFHYLIGGDPPFINMTEYQRRMTKTCLHYFKHQGIYQRTLLASGDSGSPITCGDVYVGLVSQGENIVDGWDYMEDLIFYAYANSMDYRPRLIRNLEETYPEYFNLHVTIQLPVGPRSPPPNFAEIISNSACAIRVSYFIFASAIFHVIGITRFLQWSQIAI